MNRLLPLRRRRFSPLHSWFVPVGYIVLALAMGMITPRVRYGLWGQDALTLPAADAALILSTIASGMMALTGITFSLVFVMVQFGSSTYSPRLVAWFSRSPVIPHSVGVFIGTFLFALLGLANLHAQNDQVAPAMTVLTAFLWVFASIGALIWLIERITSLYISNVLGSIGQRGRTVITLMYPTPASEAAPAPSTSWQTLPVHQTLYHHGGPLAIAALDMNALVRLARRADGVIEMAYAVGDTVTEGAALLRVRGTDKTIAKSALKNAVILSTERTIEQDPKYALRLLADIAIRALSPAINDPTTAVMALDQIEDLLRRLGQVNLDIGHETDRDGVLRLVYPAPDWVDLLELAFLEIMHYGEQSIQVMRRLIALFSDLEDAVVPTRRADVRNFAMRLHETVERSFVSVQDRRDAEELDRQGLGLARHKDYTA
ncbi:MAG: DUF2254 domain-containing protein [Caldilineales bacterium]